VTQGDLDNAVRRAYNLFDAWNEVTGLARLGTSYYYELQSLMGDAVHCGAQAATGDFKRLDGEEGPIPGFAPQRDGSMSARDQEIAEHLRTKIQMCETIIALRCEIEAIATQNTALIKAMGMGKARIAELEAENARLNMEMAAYRQSLTPRDAEAMQAVITALEAEKAARSPTGDYTNPFDIEPPCTSETPVALRECRCVNTCGKANLRSDQYCHEDRLSACLALDAGAKS
jgi:FtsZ-binding cell division protein ZapB